MSKVDLGLYLLKDRYRTWDEAINAHKNIAEMVKADFVFGYDII